MAFDWIFKQHFKLFLWKISSVPLGSFGLTFEECQIISLWKWKLYPTHTLLKLLFYPYMYKLKKNTGT